MVGKDGGQGRAATTPTERFTAYVQTCAKSTNRAELILLLESANEPGFGDIWHKVIGRWTPPAPDPDDEAALSRFIARIAADDSGFKRPSRRDHSRKNSRNTPAAGSWRWRTVNFRSRETTRNDRHQTTPA